MRKPRRPGRRRTDYLWRILAVSVLAALFIGCERMRAIILGVLL